MKEPLKKFDMTLDELKEIFNQTLTDLHEAHKMAKSNDQFKLVQRTQVIEALRAWQRSKNDPERCDEDLRHYLMSIFREDLN